MDKNCKQCGGGFEVTDDDLDLLKRISPKLNPPKFCFHCRLQRKLSFRNERYLYKRKCDLCDKSIISYFDDKVQFPVYCVECWWRDDWDPMEYGRDYDFSRSFFNQFKDLLKVVPKCGMLHLNSENCDYNSLIGS